MPPKAREKRSRSNPPQLSGDVHVINQTDQVRLMHTKIRDEKSSREDFVFYSDRLIRLIVEEGLSFLPAKPITVNTPTQAPYKGLQEGAHVCGVSIMRAGESMEQALRETCRGVRIGKILIQRNEATKDKTPDERYNYAKMPKDIKNRWVLLLDPMLATGGSSILAVNTLIKRFGVREDHIIFLNVVSCPEGLASFHKAFPKIRIVTSAIDERLNEHKYIVPGLGDFGDRYFGTN